MDKNQAVIDYLLTCEDIQNSPLYFNFINAKDGTKQLLTLSNDKNIQKPYVDGSVEKRYQLTIQDYRSISSNALVNIPGFCNKNVDDFKDVQALLDWIKVQNQKGIFPNFGQECIIDEILTTTDNPRLDSIDASTSPPLARYSFTITINYLDISGRIWSKED